MSAPNYIVRHHGNILGAQRPRPTRIHEIFILEDSKTQRPTGRAGVSFGIQDSSILQLDTLTVDPTLRDQGHGSQLLTAVLENARGRFDYFQAPTYNERVASFFRGRFDHDALEFLHTDPETETLVPMDSMSIDGLIIYTQVLRRLRPHLEPTDQLELPDSDVVHIRAKLD